MILYPSIVLIKKLFFILVPSLWIGIVEAALRNWFPDGNLWFFGFFTDICNDIKFIFIFVMGFGLAAADEHDLKNVIKKGRWFNLVIGKSVYLCHVIFPDNEKLDRK